MLTYKNAINTITSDRQFQSMWLMIRTNFTIILFVFSLSTSTKRKCAWAVRLFNEWKAWHISQAVNQATLETSTIWLWLVEMTKDELCFSFTRFAVEATKCNGDPYPAETLHELVTSLQLHLSVNGREIRFLQDKEFLVLKNTPE